ncbi:MAG: DUF3737 family protein [Spirochaetaceae bacterium]|nr:DUF3737 family protein [Spirochaetaceae bacterium]
MVVENKTFDEERALYGSSCITVRNCRFDGPQDGESALKESKEITVENSFFNLRYPFWHDDYLSIKNCELTELCRAALWYTGHADISGTALHGIKALRECHDIRITDCSIKSPEFGWSVNNAMFVNSSAESEYFMMRSSNLSFENFRLNGKYSFQYVENMEMKNCNLNTKDAFWHSKNVTVRDSVINGEYLAWYSDHLTLINCTITGTQPFCYCTNLTLINCKMINTDLAFEKSEVQAEITTPVDSIKNPHRGKITLPHTKELIITEDCSKCEIIQTDKKIS